MWQTGPKRSNFPHPDHFLAVFPTGDIKSSITTSKQTVPFYCIIMHILWTEKKCWQLKVNVWKVSSLNVVCVLPSFTTCHHTDHPVKLLSWWEQVLLYTNSSLLCSQNVVKCYGKIPKQLTIQYYTANLGDKQYYTSCHVVMWYISLVLVNNWMMELYLRHTRLPVPSDINLI